MSSIRIAQHLDAVAVIQARMTSTRLPGKVLRALGGRAVLDHVIDRAGGFSDQVVVCTSTDRSDDPIEAHCASRAVVCIRGSLENVFDRFRTSLSDERVMNSTWFFRVTADNPLLSVSLGLELLDRARDGDAYLSWRHEQLACGTASELVHRETFMNIDPDVLDGPAREHVTLHLYEHADQYRAHRLQPPPAYARPELRLTLDYPEDLRMLEALFGVDTRLSAQDAIAYLDAHPEVKAINADCVQKAAR